MQKTDSRLPTVVDEIYLIDLWRVIIKRKVFVLAMPTLSLLVAAVDLFVKAPIFESRAVIQIGQIGQIEVPAVLMKRLQEQYRVNDTDSPTATPMVADISLDKKGANSLITILVQDHSAEGAQRYLAQVVDALLAEHTKLYSQTMDILRQRLQSLDKQIKALSDHLEKLSAHIEDVGKQGPTQAAILAIEKGKLLTEIPGLEREHTTLRLALSDIQSQPSKLLRGPTLPNSQVKPKHTQMLALAAILGLMFGIVAVFLFEFFGKARQQLSERAVKEATEP
jgi:LPS O-antigen subunit length determinant protein (WzzB/FepE family)